MRNQFSSTVLSSALLCGMGHGAPVKPNVLLIIVDDLKPNLACYGDPIAKTPNIDRLAGKGFLFEHAYCQQAVCTPSRASFMTGRRPDDTRVWNLETRFRKTAPGLIPIPDYFQRHGYITSAFGKVYHHEDQGRWSIPYRGEKDLAFSPQTGAPAASFYQNPAVKEAVNRFKAQNHGRLPWRKLISYLNAHRLRPSTECLDVPDDAYGDGVIAREAVKRLTELSRKQQPFFLITGFRKPHLPFVAPKRYWDLYDRASLPLARFQEHAMNSPDIAYHGSQELRKGYSDIDDDIHKPIPPAKQRELIHGYYACVSYIDAQIGKVLRQLDTLGLTKNTIIVLIGDHGWHLGDHGLWCKHTNFENATRSPMIIVPPGSRSGKKLSTPVEYLDVFPTLCSLAGLPIPSELDGKSLTSLMKGAVSDSATWYAVSQYPRGGGNRRLMGYSLRTRQYRYTAWYPWDQAKGMVEAFSPVAEELYDYRQDPLETVSRIKDPRYLSVRHSLKALLEKHLRNGQRVKDNLPVAVPSP